MVHKAHTMVRRCCTHLRLHLHVKVLTFCPAILVVLHATVLNNLSHMFPVANGQCITHVFDGCTTVIGGELQILALEERHELVEHVATH